MKNTKAAKAKVEATAATAATVRVIGEKLAGNTLDGAIETTIKRHTLKGESMCMMIKRLLETEGMTREKLIVEVEKVHGALKDSTLNTIRCDLKRTRGALVCCTGWRTDKKHGKLATAAVAKLRTHVLGVSAFSAGLITAAAKLEAVSEKGATDTAATQKVSKKEKVKA